MRHACSSRLASNNQRQSPQRSFEMYFVDRYPREDSANSNRFDDCIINDETYAIDRDFIDEDLCVTVTCKGNGEVYVDKLEDCRL